MSTPGSWLRARRDGCRPAFRWAGGWALLLIPLLATGCGVRAEALARPAPHTLPPGSPLRDPGMPEGDAWLRHHLMLGEHHRALELLAGSRVVPGDRLLRALQEGAVLHYAGQYARSNQVLEWAEVEADLRYTRSLSREAGSLLTSDRTLEYRSTATELAMVPYYRILNYLALGELDEAVVEARKANALLARLARGPEARCLGDVMLQYLAGLVQHAGGERSDALVSLRMAEAAFRGCAGDAEVRAPSALGADVVRVATELGLTEVADTVAQRYGVSAPDTTADAGELVLLVEQGFMAHREEEALHIPVFPDDLEGAEGGGAEAVAAAAGRVTARLLGNQAERAAWGQATGELPAVQLADALSGAYVMRLAWPVARRQSRGLAIRALVGDSVVSVATVGDLSTLAEQELEAQRAAMITRLVARGLAKYLVVSALEKKAEKQGGELAGFIVGRLTNAAAYELERADTRSWSLLPDRVSLLRARLPAGEHRVRLEVLSATGEVLQVREVGPVRIRAGETSLRSERVWPAGSGAGPRRTQPVVEAVGPNVSGHPDV